MFIEPGIEVNPVVDAAPADPNERDAQLHQQSGPDAQVDGRLVLGQAANGRQRQVRVFHHRSGRPFLAR